jgi:enamine deaminase RidA (YjgF/YER057c/UK114 family)
MKVERVDPWSWQDPFQFSQALRITDPRRLLVCSGQASLDPEGRVVGAGDMKRQIEQALANLEAVLAAAGFALSGVVRLVCYTTDVGAYRAASDVLRGRLAAAGVKPAFSLVGVAELAYPDLMVELEATAVD